MKECNLIPHQVVFAGGTVVLLARLVRSDNVTVVQSDIISIRVDLYDTSCGSYTPVDVNGSKITDGSAFATPSAAAVISNTVTFDSRWKQDSVGWNSLYRIAPPIRDHQYQVRMTYALNNGDTLVDAFNIDAV
jgi:hypothetical protein